MTDKVYDRIDAIVSKYEQGMKLSYDAVIEIAEEVNATNINDVFLRLPEKLKTRFRKFASDCDSKHWVFIGGNSQDESRNAPPPVNSDTVALLKSWLNQHMKT